MNSSDAIQWLQVLCHSSDSVHANTFLVCDAERAGIVDLHRDVQTCGYHDVQVMWGMLGLDATGTPAAPERRNRSPPFWYFLPWRRAAAAAR